jgi:predicted PurR-regulated permease PerM
MSVLSISLTPAQREVEERLRTAVLLLIGLAVVAAGLYYLKTILIPLVLALALFYTLQPVIEVLTKRPLKCCGRRYFTYKPDVARIPRCLRPCVESCLLLRLPHLLAVCVALLIAFAILALLGFVVADSVRVFSSKAAEYTERVEQLTGAFLSWMDTLQADWNAYLNPDTEPPAEAASGTVDNRARIHELTQHIPITGWIVSMLSSLVDVLSNLFLVLLFTIYLLIGSAPEEDSEKFDLLAEDSLDQTSCGGSPPASSSARVGNRCETTPPLSWCACEECTVLIASSANPLA